MATWSKALSTQKRNDENSRCSRKLLGKTLLYRWLCVTPIKSIVDRTVGLRT